METIFLVIACLPIALFILWLAIVWTIYLFQEINHSLRKAMRNAREIFLGLKWKKAQFSIKRQWK